MAVSSSEYENISCRNAVEAALSEMPDDFVIKNFLLQNKDAVKEMFATEFGIENALMRERHTSERRGVKQGIKRAYERVAGDMLRKNLSLDLIAEISKLSEEAILNLAKKLGVTVT